MKDDLPFVFVGFGKVGRIRSTESVQSAGWTASMRIAKASFSPPIASFTDEGPVMNSLAIVSIAFACMFGGALTGVCLRRLLPGISSEP